MNFNSYWKKYQKKSFATVPNAFRASAFDLLQAAKGVNVQPLKKKDIFVLG